MQKGRSEASFRERGGAEYGVAILYAGFKFVWRPTRIQNDHIWIWPTVQLIFIFLLINLKKKIVSPFLFLFPSRYVFMCWTLSWMCFNNRFLPKTSTSTWILSLFLKKQIEAHEYKSCLEVKEFWISFYLFMIILTIIRKKIFNKNKWNLKSLRIFNVDILRHSKSIRAFNRDFYELLKIFKALFEPPLFSH